MRVPLPGRDYFPPRVLLSATRSALGGLRGLEAADAQAERSDDASPMGSAALTASTSAAPPGIRASLA